jgi:sigma-B regulation protein RsbU (phosphoserine phosphatase)
MKASEHIIKGDFRLRLVKEISRKITSSVDLEEVLEFMAGCIAQVTSSDAVAVYLPTPEDDSLHFVLGCGALKDPVASIALRALGGPEWPAVALSDGANLDSDGQFYVAKDPKGSWRLLAPVVIEGKMVAAFEIESGIENNGPANLTEETLEWLSVLTAQAAIFIDKAVLHKELIEKKRLEEELRIAREVQLSLLPAAAPMIQGLDMDGINVPTHGVGGDYFDFIPIVDGHVGIVVADVAGKGIPAALIMASFRAVLRAEIRNNYAIRTILTKVNRLLNETLRSDQFVSAFYGVLDLARRRFTYSNAGHHPAILFRPDGKRRYLKSGGIVLGIFETASYNETFIDLVPGDLLLLYTDGLVEAENAAGEMYGRARLERFITANAQLGARALCDAVYADMTAFTESAHPSDDTTIVIAKILG